MLSTIVKFIIYILRFNYFLSLIKFSENRVGMVFYTKMFNVKEFKFKNLPALSVSLSDDKNEVFQELVIIYVSFWQLKYDILQLR